MQPNAIITKLKSNRFVFQHLLEGCSREHYLFKPLDDSWCLLEVICHLLDEEREDFRTRVKHVLTTPDLPLQPITPETWPLERDYLQQDFEIVVQDFLNERQKSVTWLLSLEHPRWSQTVDHPDVGPRSAQKFLINWLAHDYHHIRQINRINHAFLKYSSGDDLTYAGRW